MHTGSSSIRSLRRRGRSRLDHGPKNGRMARIRWLDLEGLESRTLLATIPAATATGAAVNLTNLSSVTTGGNANSPAVVIDPYDSEKLFAVWSVHESSVTPVPYTTSIVEGAYSNNGGASWAILGSNSVAPVQATPSQSTPVPRSPTRR